MAAGGLSQGPCEEKLCSVCNGYRADPVILDCGHRFCQACLAKGSCLQCGETSQECNLQSDQELAQNIGQEQHVAEESKESKLQEVSSTMAVATVIMDLIQDIICPICQELPTDLVTLACDHTFCRCCINGLYETHEKLCEEMGKLKCPVCKAKIQKGDHRPNWMLANIVQKIKRNKSILVTRALCKKHNENLHLFCKDDAELLCVFCEHSPEHKGHSVHLQEEAAQEYKIQLGVEKQKVKSIFEQMHDFLNEKEGHCLTELCDLEKEMEMEQEESVTQLSREIAKLNDLISEMEAKLGQPPDEFLQDIKSTLSRSGRKPEHVEDVFPKLEERLCIYSQKTSAVKEIMEECKESLERELSKVSVTLDPETAYQYLVVSEDLKSVRYGERKLDLLRSRERFYLDPCVLGRERFMAGRHWWEVEVRVEVQEEEETEWAVGVVRESFKQTSWNSLTPPTAGVWAVGKERKSAYGSLDESFPPCFLWAFTSPEWTCLARNLLPRKIQVSLDYEKGYVEFFDTDGDNPIFCFSSASFSGEGIRPYFYVGYGVCLKC
ncbi:zinc finger protein RFP-like isoform X2 [Varanus komodoensis]|uniref:zinc finger protein RFP-like isoform X2 n=1 Tax=Varanus komodoensis TaxID=61221 RepID=UPI001CF7E611|nr:zinc finger protein RFP-like isoform X2 [Varanus komodoensis]